MSHGGDKQADRKPHSAVKKVVDFFVSGFTFILIKAYSHQIKSRVY